MSNAYRVRIKRFDPRSQETSVDVFEVPKEGLYRVLDVLYYIYDRLDPTLAFRRHLCREGFCHSCEAKVNGKRVLTCLTLIHRLDEIAIEPLEGYPLIRDLVVDFGTEVDMLAPKRRTVVDEGDH